MKSLKAAEEKTFSIQGLQNSVKNVLKVLSDKTFSTSIATQCEGATEESSNHFLNTFEQEIAYFTCYFGRLGLQLIEDIYAIYHYHTKNYKIHTANEHIKESRHNASFTYIDEISARGEIDIRFYNMTSSDYGTYYIFLNNKHISSRIYFNITGPPKCPNNLTSEELDQNTVRLTWSPITYEISEQLFKIFKADRLGDVHVATVSDEKKMILSYNVTGLSPNTKYSFYLHVKAGQFENPCKHVITSVLIKGPAALPQDGDTNDMFYIIPIVALVVLLVICVVIIVVVRKIKLNQKNKNTFNDQKDYRYNCGSEAISAQQSSPSDVNISANPLAPVCSSEVAENIYNNVLENQAHQGAKALKPARKSGSSVKLKEKVSIATGKRQASTLPLGKTLVTWDDDINVYEN
uniref:Fibronectin type-III domain-containing protein n=1 Tax=Biomphalaria glabrata TaxID=6526 RepID=A0A2C9L4J4_BIOGL